MINIDEKTRNRIVRFRKRKEFSNKHGLKLIVIGLILYALLATGILLALCLNESSLATPVGILIFAGPIVAFVVSIIFTFKSKPKPSEIERVFEELSNKGVSALELYEIEKELDVMAYANSFVIEKRCKELGLKGVPEVCARDGILPTEDMVSRFNA